MSRFDDQPTLDSSGNSPESSWQPVRTQFPYKINSRYQCHSLLGHGSSGAVYRAYDHQLHREVAIKFIHRRNLTERQRLLAEARILAQLDHPNICQVYEVAEEGEAVYLVMSLIKGQSLSQVKGQFTHEQIVNFVAQICAGLTEAHRNGIIHCDVKPSNIVLQQNDTNVTAILVDFGVAYGGGATSSSATGAGTQYYMAPERSDSGKSLNPTIDVYALGATLRVLLTGQHDNSALTTLPIDLQLIINRCLASSPDSRYPHAGPLCNDLRAWLTKHPISLRTSPVYRLCRLWQRSRWLRGTTITACILAFTIILSAGIYQTNIQERQLQQVQLHEQATRIESQIDAIYRSPVHDLNQSLSHLRGQIEAWLTPSSEQPNWLTATQLSAAGRVLLQLNENENAERALTEAWRLGERSDNTAMALAILHQRLFTQELANARNLAQADLRNTAIEQAHLQYRLPALKYLNEVSQTNLPANYIRAMQAYLEGDEHTALRILRNAQFPDWFYQRYELGLAIAAERLNNTLTRRAESDIPLLISHTEFFADQLITRTPSHSYAYLSTALIYNTLHLYRPNDAPPTNNWLGLAKQRLDTLYEIAPTNPQYHQYYSSWLHHTGSLKNELAYMQRSVRHAELALRYAKERNYNLRRMAGLQLAALTRLNFLISFFENKGISTERALHRYFTIAESIGTPYRGAAFYTQLSEANRRQALNHSGSQAEGYWQLAGEAISNAHAIAPQIPTITANLGVFLMRRAPSLPPGDNLEALRQGVNYLQEAHEAIPGNIAIAYNYASVILKRINWAFQPGDAELAATALQVIRTAKTQVPNHQLFKNVTADILMHWGHLIDSEQSHQEQLEEVYELVDTPTPDGLSLIRLIRLQRLIWQAQLKEDDKQRLISTLHTVHDGLHNRAYLNAAMTSIELLAFNHQQTSRQPESAEQLHELFKVLAAKIHINEPKFIVREMLQGAAIALHNPNEISAVTNACGVYQGSATEHSPALVFGEKNWHDIEVVAHSIEVLFDVPCRIETDTESVLSLSAFH